MCVAFLIFSLYIFKGFSRRGVYSILTLSVFVIVFSILFSPVKLTYRTMDLANFSLIEKSKVIFNLISENNSKDLQDREDEKSTLWRLTYSLSAISLVIEKTPNTVPLPPKKLAPPIMHAAIASNSALSPALG